MKRVVIVGGGIAGLATAHRVAELNRNFQKSFEIIVCEASSEWGGIIKTVSCDGFVMEQGPDCFISDKPWGLDLCDRLGLKNELVSTQEQFRRSFILHKNKLIPVPAGLYLTIPTNGKAFLNLPGISLWGKIRMLFDFFIPAGDGKKDESMGQFIRRRFGSEVLEKIAQPMIAGIYSANPENLSVLATFPKFKKMESEAGSLLKACWVGKEKRTSLSEASGPRYSLFVSFRKGMQTLTDALIAQLTSWKDPNLCIDLKINTPISHISFDQTHWMLETSEGKIQADAILLAVSSFASANLTSGFAEALSSKLRSIPYEPIATLNLIYQRGQIGHPLDGFGFVVPAVEQSSLIACSFSSIKFLHRAPTEKVLLRAFIKGKHASKEAISKLSKVLSIQGDPLAMHLKEYSEGLPQYEVGHLEKVKEIELERRKYPNLYLVGNAYLGPGIPDIVYQAEERAREMIENL